MSDSQGPRNDDPLGERRDSFEPVDTRMWELPDKHLVTPGRRRNRPARYIVPGLIALLIAVILLILWVI